MTYKYDLKVAIRGMCDCEYGTTLLHGVEFPNPVSVGDNLKDHMGDYSLGQVKQVVHYIKHGQNPLPSLIITDLLADNESEAKKKLEELVEYEKYRIGKNKEK